MWALHYDGDATCSKYIRWHIDNITNNKIIILKKEKKSESIMKGENEKFKM